MWGPSKLYSDNAIVVGVTNMDRAAAWYCAMLGLSSQSKEPDKMYLGNPAGRSGVLPLIILVTISPGQTNVYADRHQILFTRNLEAVHAEFASVGIQMGPIQGDSGGNRFFKWQDLEGNTIEVCQEPEAPPDPDSGLVSGPQ